MSFVHEKAVVLGRVALGEGSSVWPGAVIRGDEGEICIGKKVSVQDNCVIHGSGVSIGDNVTIGHGAIVHGAKIGSNVLIGMAAIVLDKAEIGDWCLVGAGALVPPGKKLESGVWLGAPAKRVRELTSEDRELITRQVDEYQKHLRGKNIKD